MCLLQSVPFLEYFETRNSGKNQFYYSKTAGHCDLATFIPSVVSEAGTNHAYYLCGPSTFMQEAAHALVQSGVPRSQIKWEAFSPQLSCPV